MTDNSQHLEFDGEVVSSIKGVMQVLLETGQQIQCHLGGKLRKHKINVIVGDRVRVKISPYDLSKGIVTYRK